MATTGKVLVTGATGNTGPGLVSALCAVGVEGSGHGEGDDDAPGAEPGVPVMA